MALTAAVDPEELEQLRARYGDFPFEQFVLDMGPYFFEEARRPVKQGRRAEVLLVVEGPDGRVLVHTKRFYPSGTFRLLSGGVHEGEPVEVALARELAEETGVQATNHCLMGVLAYDIRHGGETLPFASYVYRVRIPTTDVHVEDEEEQICDLRWVPFSELPSIRDKLLQVPPEWQDWGRFRALGHDFVLRHQARCKEV